VSLWQACRRHYPRRPHFPYYPLATARTLTKMGLHTGTFLANPATTGLEGTYEPVFPIGFYTTLDGYLASNLSVIDDLKEQGFFHPSQYPSDYSRLLYRSGLHSDLWLLWRSLWPVRVFRVVYADGHAKHGASNTAAPYITSQVT
jgi:hypothetical protein